jgi:hypothetical protein
MLTGRVMQELIQSIEAVITDMRDAAVWLGPDAFDDDALLRFLDETLRLTRLKQARLSSIELDFDRHRHLPDEYWHIPVLASTQRGVIRLTFDPVRPIHT